MSLEWAHVIVHTAHPVELGQWWADALSWAVVWQSEDEYSIRPAPDQRPGLTFVTMRDAKVTKNRLHLDFYPDSQTAEVDRLLAMVAQRADVGQGSQSWVVLADPERNEFLSVDRLTNAIARSFWSIPTKASGAGSTKTSDCVVVENI